MDEIKKDFEAYLKEITKFTFKPTDLQSRSHLFNMIINDKHKEILSKNPNLTELELKIELAPIRVKYQSEFLRN